MNTPANTEGGLSPLEELIAAFVNNETHPLLWLHEKLDKEQVGAELVKVPFEPVDTLGERIAEALAFGEVTTVWARCRVPAGNDLKMARRIRVAPLRPLAPPAAAPLAQRPPDRLERVEAAVERLTQALAGGGQGPQALGGPPATAAQPAASAPTLLAPPAPPQPPSAVLPPVASPMINDAWTVVNGAFDLVGRLQKSMALTAPSPSPSSSPVDVDKMVALAREAEQAKAAASSTTQGNVLPVVKEIGEGLLKRIGEALDLGKAYVKEVRSTEAQAQLELAKTERLRAERGNAAPAADDVEVSPAEGTGET